MKTRGKENQALIRRTDIDTILRAKAGDQTAVERILEHYKGYMLELCKFELYDASGMAYDCYDEDLYHELQIKLMLSVLEKFERRIAALDRAAADTAAVLSLSVFHKG